MGGGVPAITAGGFSSRTYSNRAGLGLSIGILIRKRHTGGDQAATHNWGFDPAPVFASAVFCSFSFS